MESLPRCLGDDADQDGSVVSLAASPRRAFQAKVVVRTYVNKSVVRKGGLLSAFALCGAVPVRTPSTCPLNLPDSPSIRGRAQTPCVLTGCPVDGRVLWVFLRALFIDSAAVALPREPGSAINSRPLAS